MHWLGDPVNTPNDGWAPTPPGFVSHMPRTEDQPRNAGRVWTYTNDAVLTTCYRAKMSTSEIARQMGRSHYAIICRLKHLGLISEAHANRDGNFDPLPATINSKELNVNTMHLITLLQEGYTTVRVSLTQDTTGRSYTYKAPLDMDLKVGDHVVVPTRSTFSVAKIVEVHSEPQVNFHAPYALKWVVQRVDMAAYEDQVVREAAALEHLNKVKQKKEQEELLKTLFGTKGELNKLKKLLKNG